MKFNLSEITEVIKNRRSVYPEAYTSRVVHPEMVEDVLNNAIWAPTHGMVQPWRFKVFTGDAVKRAGMELERVYKSVVPEEKWSQRKLDKLKSRTESISVLIFICMTPDGNTSIPEIENVSAVACAVQNMYLTCTAYGLGSYWSSPSYVYSKEMNDFLGLKEGDKCLGMFFMGYPAEEWPKSHRKPLEYVSEWFDK
ncbi:MAG: nitroreductase [Flavobacteriales bacterium]